MHIAVAGKKYNSAVAGKKYNSAVLLQERCNKYDLTVAQCFWLAHHNFWGSILTKLQEEREEELALGETSINKHLQVLNETLVNYFGRGTDEKMGPNLGI